MSIPVSLSADREDKDEVKPNGKARNPALDQAATRGKEGLSHGV